MCFFFIVFLAELLKVEMERLQFKHKGNEGVLTGQILELESKLADLRQEQVRAKTDYPNSV